MSCKRRVGRKLLQQMLVTQTAAPPHFAQTFVDAQSENGDALNHSDTLRAENWGSKVITPPQGGFHMQAGEDIAFFRGMWKKHRRGVKKCMQSMNVDTRLLTNDHRDNLICDQALLKSSELERVVTKESILMAKLLSLDVAKLKKKYHLTLFCFMLGNCCRMGEIPRIDSGWASLIQSSAQAGGIAPLGGISLVEIGRQLMIRLLGAAAPAMGAKFTISDETCEKLVDDLAAAQKWIATKHYSPQIGPLGARIAKVKYLRAKGSSANSVVKALLATTTPFHIDIRGSRETVIMRGERGQARSIEAHWPFELGIALAGGRARLIEMDPFLCRVAPAIQDEDVPAFKLRFHEWASTKSQ